MDEAATRALATRFFDAIEQGDVETVKDCYDPAVEIWHNFDDLIQTREENLQTLTGMVGRISDRSYGNRRLDIFPGGFVQQHVLSGTRKDGARVSLPAALICRLKDGKIVRLDEYIDSAHVAEFRKTA
jgi:ketosteroid isomerase-like protein